MNSINKSLQMALNNIRKWAYNPRIYIIGILIFLFAINYISPLVQASNAIGYRFTPWFFPLIVNDASIQRIILLGLIFLFCDAPFLDITQPYTIIRCNRRQWAVGQITYIVMASGIYLLLLNISSMIVGIRNIHFTSEWGKIFSTFANTNAGNSFGVNYVDYNIVSNFTPIEATINSFMLEWLVAIFLGLTMFVLNMYLKRGLGAIIASFIVLVDSYISLGSIYMSKLSPVTFARLSMIDNTGISAKPTLLYAFSVLVILNVILVVVAIVLVRYKDIEVREII